MFLGLIFKDNFFWHLSLKITLFLRLENASTAGELMKQVPAIKNEVKDKEQVRDVVMSDQLKTLREPIIEQQKKTDGKEDKEIEQLQKNQRAITSGFEDLVMLQQ